MDKYKQKMVDKCGPAGLKCSCCNPYHKTDNKNKAKRRLNRIARRRLKQEDSKNEE
jgi:hypothetical protein